ncbi:MAG: ribonuclease HII [Candidatus Njordarchaeota archaeon]
MKPIILKQINISKKGYVGGIDEAGRGPVIGPMVIAMVIARSILLDSLESLGVKDSKMLTKKKRNELFEQILALSDGVIVVYLDPPLIDKWVARHALNELEAMAIAQLIKNIKRPCTIIIDTPSSVKNFREHLEKYIDKDIKHRLILKPKADQDEVIVAAASIIAKVLRDRKIDEIKKRLGIDFGSGYPSDPKTQAQLDKIIEKDPTIVRKSWKTIKKLAYPSLDNFI